MLEGQISKGNILREHSAYKIVKHKLQKYKICGHVYKKEIHKDISILEHLKIASSKKQFVARNTPYL